MAPFEDRREGEGDVLAALGVHCPSPLTPRPFLIPREWLESLVCGDNGHVERRDSRGCSKVKDFLGQPFSRNLAIPLVDLDADRFAAEILGGPES